MRRALGLLLCAIVLVAPAFFLSGYHLFQLATTAVYAVAIVGLGLVSTTGQISLGHGAFFAIGAYAAALLMGWLDLPYWATLPAAALLCGILGLLVGLPAVRLSGPYLALVTFSLAVAVPQILRARALEAWTGGAQGLGVTAPDAPEGVDLTQDQFLYLFTMLVSSAMFALAWWLRRGRTLRAMVAVRDHPMAAEAAGIDVTQVKVAAFAVSAAFTGVAGALSALIVQFIAPDSFPVQLSIALFVGLVVGGAGSLPGAVIGGLFLTFVPNISEQVSKSAPGLVYGLLLVAVLTLLPGGVSGLAGRLGRFVRTTPRTGG